MTLRTCGRRPADKELDELFENNADELLSFTQEMVDGMSELLSDFKEIEEMMKDDQSSRAPTVTALSQTTAMSRVTAGNLGRGW